MIDIQEEHQKNRMAHYNGEITDDQYYDKMTEIMSAEICQAIDAEIIAEMTALSDLMELAGIEFDDFDEDVDEDFADVDD